MAPDPQFVGQRKSPGLGLEIDFIDFVLIEAAEKMLRASPSLLVCKHTSNYNLGDY